MRCNSCGFISGDDDHRCLKCGRRLKGTVVAAPAGYVGANALSLDLLPLTPENLPPVETSGAAATDQAPLFWSGTQAIPTQWPKVIPFDQLQQHQLQQKQALQPATETAPLREQAPVTKPVSQPPAPRTYHRKASRLPEGQASLDLQSDALAHRTTKSNVQTQIDCDSTVAPVAQRFAAGAFDGAMIVIGFGIFAGVAMYTGSGFGSGKWFWAALAACMAMSAMFYGLLFALSGRETAGMQWAQLRLITFDGYPLEPANRAIRFASSWLSFCSGGLGLLWAIADEESLTWHDHISKTFPTVDGARNKTRMPMRRR